MAEDDLNPFGGQPFGDAPFGPRPEDEEAAAPAEGWRHQWQRVRPVRSLAIAAAGLVLVYAPPAADNTVTIDKWQQPLSKAVAIPRPAPRGGLPFVPREATRDNTTNTVWPLVRQGEKARPRPRTAPLGSWVFGYPYQGVDNTGTAVQWPLQIGYAKAVPIPRPAPRGGSPFVPREATRDNTTNTVWPLTFGHAARPIPRAAPRGGWFFGYPYEVSVNSRTEWDWHVRWPDRMPRFWWRAKPYQPFVPDRFVIQNTVTPDKWMERWQGPPRYWPAKTQVTYQVNERVEVVHQQSIDCDIVLTVDFHICGWGTETQEVDAASEQAQTADAWTTQDEDDSDYDEQDECGR